MAFSMFVRTPACTSRVFTQHIKALATQPSLLHRAVAKSLPVSSLALKEVNTTPIINAVRSFRTSSANLSAEKAHDHSKLWVIEKAVSAALIPLIPLGLLMPNKLTDTVIALLICAHTFWGLEAVAVDYLRAAVVGPLIAKLAIAAVYFISIATLGGLFYIISHDDGLANIIRQFWAIKSEQNA